MKICKLFILLPLVLLGNLSFSQSNYSVQLIPDKLKESASVIVRNKEERFDIKSKSSASFYSFEAITILNSNGREHATKVIP